MKKLLIIVLALGFTFCILSANATQEKKSTPASSDTTGVQKNKSKKLKPKQKLKEYKPTKEEISTRKPDTLKLFIPDRPLLRLKDSSQNNSH
ncbi:MAG: hypothetical protein ABSD46_12120 [Bacteroidota bacterium]